jgi:hypothetical protein
VKWNSRIAACLVASALLFSPAGALAADAPKLKITENRRYLQYENGKPFFYLGDTAWELFHRLNREEATQYLTNRAQKGFTFFLDGCSIHSRRLGWRGNRDRM